MAEYTIRSMSASELKTYFKQIQRDFPPGEYPPYDILSRHIEAGIQDGMVLCMGQQQVAYAVCAASTDHVLLSLLAVWPEFRGQGVGSAFLGLLKSRYIEKQAIIGEVERPETASHAEEMSRRLQRIHFYEKAGYHLIPGIDYTIWDVPMHLMALSIKASPDAISENIETIMYQIYLHLMGQNYMHKMIFNKTP